MNIWNKTYEQAISKLKKAGNKDKKFLIVANSFAQIIQSAQIQENTALPTQRQLALKLNLTLATINRVYQHLAQQNLIISYPGKGSFTLKQTAFEHKQIDRLNDTNLTAQLNKPQITTYSKNQHTLPNHIDARFIQASNPTQVKLNDKQLAHDFELNHFLKSFNLNTMNRSAFITPSFYEALEATLMYLLKPNDTLLCFELTYHVLSKLANKHNFNIKTLPLKDNKIDLSVLEQYCKTIQPAAIFIHSCIQTPTGLLFSTLEQQQIADICQRFSIQIIEDSSLNWTLNQPRSFTQFNPKSTFSLCSLSSLPLIESRQCITQTPQSTHFEFELMFSNNNHINDYGLLNRLNLFTQHLNDFKTHLVAQVLQLNQLLDKQQFKAIQLTINNGFIWISCSSTDQSNHLMLLLGNEKVLTLTQESFNTELEKYWNRRIHNQNSCGLRLCFSHLNTTAIQQLATALVRCVNLLEFTPNQSHQLQTQHQQQQTQPNNLKTT